MKKIQSSFLFVIILVTVTSCKKYLETGPPPTQLVASTVFENNSTATAALFSIYSMMESDGILHAMLLNTGLSADEFTNYSTSAGRIDIAANNITPENTFTYGIWTLLYKYIYQANAVMEGLERSTGVSEPVKVQLRAEATFVRAFCHFYLLQLFGKIPLILETNYEVTAITAQSPVPVIYQQIETDLARAKADLQSSYLDALHRTTSERVRPNKTAASALLARVYLYSGQWQKAEAEASAVIATTTPVYTLQTNLNLVFLKNSPEAIWQLQAVQPGYNTYSGGVLILTSTPREVAFTSTFINSFDSNDARKNSWVKSITVSGNTYYYPYKYKVPQNAPAITEYTMVLRLAEQYLIRAAARLELDNLAGALQDINTIRARAGLSAFSTIDKAAAAGELEKQRHAELFSESADRWIDLKRTMRADAVLQPFKGNTWATTDQLYPIPQTEIIRNPQLVQNAGY